MTNRPKAIGTAAETAVVRYLRAHGFPQAERRALTGSLDQGDITGTPGICWEVKGGTAAKTASDGQVAAWLVETETERVNSGADIGVLVLQRAGIGPANAGRWWAVVPVGVFDPEDRFPYPARLHLSDIAQVLRRYGYGDPS